MRIKDLPRFNRPREKMAERGSSSLTDAELLAILLRTGYQGKSAVEVAHRILQKTPLEKLIQMSPADLARIKGVGESRAATITATLEISRRINSNDQAITIREAADVVKIVHPITTKKREHLVALYLDARDRLIRSQTISVGTLTDGLVHPREIFGPALKCHAARLIVAHNHPSGNPTPSDADHIVTRRLKAAADLLGIQFIDHVIVTKNGYFSFRREGLLND